MRSFDIKKQMISRLSKAFVILIALLITSGLISSSIEYNKKNDARHCTTSEIAYASSSVDDPDSEIGTTTVTTAGYPGERSICVDGFDTVRSDTVIHEPVDEVISHGTMEPEIIYYEPEYEGGSICNDGSYSYSVGRGTCSWHGGVDYYL